MGQKNSLQRVTAKLCVPSSFEHLDGILLTRRRNSRWRKGRKVIASFTFPGNGWRPLCKGVLINSSARAAAVRLTKLEKKDPQIPVRVCCLTGSAIVLQARLSLGALLAGLRNGEEGNTCSLHFKLVSLRPVDCEAASAGPASVGSLALCCNRCVCSTDFYEIQHAALERKKKHGEQAVTPGCSESEKELQPAKTPLDASESDGKRAGSKEEKDLSAAEEQDLAAAREEDLAPAGEQDVAAAGEQDLPAVGEQDLAAAGEQDLAADGEQDLAADGEQDLAAAGEQDLAAVGEQDLAAAGEEDKDSSLLSSPQSQPQLEPHSLAEMAEAKIRELFQEAQERPAEMRREFWSRDNLKKVVPEEVSGENDITSSHSNSGTPSPVVSRCLREEESRHAAAGRRGGFRQRLAYCTGWMVLGMMCYNAWLEYSHEG